MKIPKQLLSLIGIFLFIYVIYSVGSQKILTTILHTNVIILTYTIPFIIIVIIIKILKWKIIVNKFDKKFSIGESFRVWMIGLFYATVTPGRLGDLIKTFYLKEKKVPFGTGLSTVFVDRAFDIVSLIILTTMGAFLVMFAFNRPDIGVYLLFLGLVLLGIILLFTHKKSALVLAKPIFNFLIPAKYKKSLRSGFDDFYKALYVLRKEKKILIAVFVLSIVSWLVSYMQSSIVFNSLGYQIPYIYLVTFLSTEVLLQLLPISISGFGTREFTFVILFSLIGISPEIAVSFGFVNLFMSLLTAIPGYFIWLIKPFKLNLTS